MQRTMSDLLHRLALSQTQTSRLPIPLLSVEVMTLRKHSDAIIAVGRQGIHRKIPNIPDLVLQARAINPEMMTIG